VCVFEGPISLKKQKSARMYLSEDWQWGHVLKFLLLWGSFTLKLKNIEKINVLICIIHFQNSCGQADVSYPCEAMWK
jgi:hypothetical protein